MNAAHTVAHFKTSCVFEQAQELLASIQKAQAQAKQLGSMRLHLQEAGAQSPALLQDLVAAIAARQFIPEMQHHSASLRCAVRSDIMTMDLV